MAATKILQLTNNFIRMTSVTPVSMKQPNTPLDALFTNSETQMFVSNANKEEASLLMDAS